MQKKDLKILFMGTPEFALGSLKALVENDFNVIGVFCKVDKPKGRGMKLAQPPVKEYAIENSIPVFQPEKLKENEEVLNILNTLKPDLIVVVAYGKILPKNILDMPKYGCINVHGSVLPKYRGAAPIQWAIINGEKISGITTMYMDQGMDTGNIITIKECEISKEDTYGTLSEKLMVLGADTLVKDLERLIENNGLLESKKQTGEYSIAPMLSKDISKICFNESVDNIVNLVRGTNPAPIAWCKLDEERIYKIYEAEKVELNELKLDDYKVGEIAYLNDKKNIFAIRCKDGFINLKIIKPAGSKLMNCGDYIRGNKVKLNEIFM